MKTLKIVSLLSLFMALAIVPFAQTKTETIPVSGNCGMCKTKIEKAAKEAGAATANWNKDKKVLTIKYNSSTTNTGKIQQSIADAGYDTRDVKATDDAYNKLHACCQYTREGAKDDSKMDCCKDGKCSKPGHNGKDCCKKS
jgi:periplasmic mercuric ion binding protein